MKEERYDFLSNSAKKRKTEGLYLAVQTEKMG